MTTDVKRDSEKRTFAELYTILGFLLACTVLMVTLMMWINSGLHKDMDRMHLDMNRMHNDFKSEHAHHAARQDAVTARIDLAYHLLYQNLKEREK